jgi:hypothetical protein
MPVRNDDGFVKNESHRRSDLRLVRQDHGLVYVNGKLSQETRRIGESDNLVDADDNRSEGGSDLRLVAESHPLQYADGNRGKCPGLIAGTDVLANLDTDRLWRGCRGRSGISTCRQQDDRRRSPEKCPTTGPGRWRNSRTVSHGHLDWRGVDRRLTKRQPLA